MTEIIKHGISKDIKTFTFKCYRCGCIFQESDNYTLDRIPILARCPECGGLCKEYYGLPYFAEMFMLKLKNIIMKGDI